MDESGTDRDQEERNSGTRTFTRDLLDASADASVTAADDVTDGESLASFVRARMQEDENLEGADFSDDAAMDVEYRTQARFLGVIPSSMRVHVIAHDDGTVSVAYPWYAFLMTGVTSHEDVEAMLSAESSGSWSDQDRARFVERVRAAFNADAAA